MTATTSRTRLGTFIIISNIGLFVLILFLRLFNGFRDDELSEVLKLLLPVHSLYLTAVVKYVLRDQRAGGTAGAVAALTPFFSLMARSFIYCHIGILYLLVIVFALGRPSFQLLSYGIPIVESFFGIYVGMIVSDVYGPGR